MKISFLFLSITFSFMINTIASNHYCLLERSKIGIFLYNYEKDSEIMLINFNGQDKLFLRSFENKDNHLLLCIYDRSNLPNDKFLFYELDTIGRFHYLYKTQERQGNTSNWQEITYLQNGDKKYSDFHKDYVITVRTNDGVIRDTRVVNKVYVKVNSFDDGSLSVFKNDTLSYSLKNDVFLYNPKFGPGYYSPDLSFDGKNAVFGYEKRIVLFFYSKNYIKLLNIDSKEQIILFEGNVGKPKFSSDGLLVQCGSFIFRDDYYVIINTKTKGVKKIDARFLTWLE